MRTVALSELVVAAGPRARSDMDLPVYSVTKHSGFVPSLEYFKKQVFSRDTAGYKIVEPGDFAYATIHLDEGSIGIAPERCLVSPMYTVFRIDRADVDSGYLIRYLKSASAMGCYEQMGNGAVHRRKAISFSVLGGLSIPLPSLSEQRRVASIIERAEEVNEARGRHLRLLDTLKASLFIDMFGDPDAAVDEASFGSVASLSGGRSIVAGDMHLDSCFRVLKISAVTSGIFDSSQSKPLPIDYVPPPEHVVRKGDLLMSRANTADHVGAVAYVEYAPSNLALPDKVWRFNWKIEAEPIFYHALLSTPAMRRRISRLATGTGGSMKNVSKAKLEAMSVPVVGLAHQREFAERARLIADTRALVARARDEGERLFDSLQAVAFQGDLRS